MTYERINFVDQSVERPRTYEMTHNADGSITLTDSFGLVNELGTPINADTMNHIEDGIVGNEERITRLEEQTDTSQFLNKTQISNCLLEVPKRINLELKDGVLTLKAGSVVIVPNGFETNGITKKFNYFKLERDIVISTLSTTAGQRFLGVQTTYGRWDGVKTYCYSGNTAKMNATTPYSYASFYNDETNKMYRGNGTNWEEKSTYSLPICKLTNDSTGTITSIDKVFNGGGHFASTVWVEKDIKGLVPNGRNDDGTLKNQEITTTNVLTRTVSGTNERQGVVLYASDVTWRKYFVSEKTPSVVSRWYNPKTNYMYTNSPSDVSAIQTDNSFYIGDIGFTDGVVDYFDINEPFRALDFNQIKTNNPYFFGQYIWSEFEPNNLSWLKSSGQWNSGSAYSSFYNWALANATAGKTGFKLSTATYTDYDFVVNTTNRTFRLPIKVKGKQGDAVIGTGIGIGYTDGNKEFTTTNFCGSAGQGVADIGLPIGTSHNETYQKGLVYGVVQDPTKSGLELDATGLSLYFFIGETAKDLGLINVSQLASNIANKLEVVESYQNGSSWCRVYSADQTGKRWCEQGGKKGANITLIVFAKEFANEDYFFNIFCQRSSYTAGSYQFYSQKTTSSITTLLDDEVGYWEAKGYIN